MVFGELLRELREAKGYSRRELGRITNFSHAYMNLLEGKDAAPSDEVVEALARVLGNRDRLYLAAGKVPPELRPAMSELDPSHLRAILQNWPRVRSTMNLFAARVASLPQDQQEALIDEITDGIMEGQSSVAGQTREQIREGVKKDLLSGAFFDSLDFEEQVLQADELLRRERVNPGLLDPAASDSRLEREWLDACREIEDMGLTPQQILEMIRIVRPHKT